MMSAGARQAIMNASKTRGDHEYKTDGEGDDERKNIVFYTICWRGFLIP